MLQSLVSSLTNVEHFANLSTDAPDLAVSDQVSRIMADLQSAASAKQLTLTNAIPADLRINLQPEELTQLIHSSLQNAVEFSQNQGTITVAGQTHRGRVELTITDHGSGIPSAKLEQLFSPFSRATDSQTLDHSGLGMNLHINKLIVEKAGGRMTLSSSDAVGQSGTTVTISLPTVKAGSRPRPVLVSPMSSPS